MNTVLGSAPCPFDLVCDGARRSSRLGEDKALSQLIVIGHQRLHFLLPIFILARILVADWSVSSTPRCLLASLDPVTDRAYIAEEQSCTDEG